MKPKAPALPIDLAAAPEPASEILLAQGFDMFVAEYFSRRASVLNAGGAVYAWEARLAADLLQEHFRTVATDPPLSREQREEQVQFVDEAFREHLGDQIQWPGFWHWHRPSNLLYGKTVDLAQRLLAAELLAAAKHFRRQAGKVQNRPGSLQADEVLQYTAALTIFDILVDPEKEKRTPQFARDFIETEADRPLYWDTMKRERRRWRQEIADLRDHGQPLPEMLADRGFERRRTMTERVFRGIRLKPKA